ncbi:general secretion pathway protein GspB [Roseateles sp.]|uniref:general secretion pathway protein GspB n=1 Tax=Roseateles sp. TaxID=1971397 RepID=UPI0025D35A4E|nr:general secretion pathway protein GspB [Roseateles sp.]MBV8037149.1 general secretion pathway protein GspB [Roseateles sp.]
MSYILDALRRAEADRERERGQVPGLHTPPSGREAASDAGPRRWWPWAGGGLLLLAGIAAGSWWAGGGPDAAKPLPPQTQPAPAATAVLPSAPPAQQAVALPPPQQPAASGSPYLPPAPPPAAPAPQSAGAAVPAPEARIPRLADLPESLRRELPKLAISGSVYSEDPASRFVIVNGEVLREGAKVGSDLVLEQIRTHELVLRFKGQRYRQPV